MFLVIFAFGLIWLPVLDADFGYISWNGPFNSQSISLGHLKTSIVTRTIYYRNGMNEAVLPIIWCSLVT